MVQNCLSFSLLVQHECIPQAILGMDVLCQAKSGMGKTAVFVLATLQQLEPVTGQVCWLVLERALRLDGREAVSVLSERSPLAVQGGCSVVDGHNGLIKPTSLTSFQMLL